MADKKSVEIDIYTKKRCPYCLRAKALLDKKGACFREIPVDDHMARREEMIARSHGRTTVPQVFIGGKHIGGCDDLYALDGRGGLDPLLR